MTSNRQLLGGEEKATALSRPYWDALHEGRFVLQQCSRCMRHQHYPRHICRYCSSEDVQFVTASGGGRVFVATLVHRSNSPVMKTKAPYWVALVHMDEGPLIFALLDHAVGAPLGMTDVAVMVDHDRTQSNQLLTVRVVGSSMRT